MNNKKTICFDLDGTLLEYDGWKGDDIFGKPLPGAADAVKKLRDKGFVVILMTCRRRSPKLDQYLKDNGFYFDDINPIGKNSPKPQAEFYIDDRAIEFKGDWNDVINKIQQKAEALEIFTIAIPHVPIKEDVPLWIEILRKVKKETNYPESSIEFALEVLKRFRESGGLERSIHVNKPPQLVEKIYIDEIRNIMEEKGEKELAAVFTEAICE
jgi:FMN phosphatase YigB (HAD superfamily)